MAGPIIAPVLSVAVLAGLWSALRFVPSDTLTPRDGEHCGSRRPSTVQASQAFNFVSGIFATAPNLKDLLENETADTLSLASGVDITIRPASFRTIRGITAVAAIADEIAFWRSDNSANPDTETSRALRPAGDDRRPACRDLFASRQTRRALFDVQAPFRADRASVNSCRQGAQPDDEPEPFAAGHRSRL